jgi:hypothetical protein
MNFLSKYGAVIVTISGTLGIAILTPAFVAAHPLAFAIANVVAQSVHAALPSIFTAK